MGDEGAATLPADDTDAADDTMDEDEDGILTLQ